MKARRGLGEMILGFGLVIAGVLLLLTTFDIVAEVEWWRFLPSLLIIWGVLQFAMSRGEDVFGPLFLVLLGTALLLAATGVISWSTFAQLWPVVLVIIGLSILVGRRRVNRLAAGAAPEQTVDVVAVLGENTRQLTSQSFKGGDATAIMGGAKLDLRDAMVSDGATINVTVVMGGVEVRVPDHWEVDLAATAILGGIEDKRRVRQMGESRAPRLRITGTVLMGGLEVKS